ncbi:fungal-specific transcription factor domain-containing protein [Aspergillus bertholletiae]|uniref:Fungal-specific transcription factor domain-containing protein n=1 Tax=Aspergillus bertholletiae TaxID=1226010 RepID=A0A5N7B3W5_9EURO|nr:fungal-specific transcription factor domain-containing protein [Aspergillus bertholletiae]
MADKDALPRTRHTSRASYACTRCKKAKRRCDITQQTAPGDSCSACRQRNEPCDSRQPREDRRRKRKRHTSMEIHARISSLENEIRILSSQRRQTENDERPADDQHNIGASLDDRPGPDNPPTANSPPARQRSPGLFGPEWQQTFPSPAASSSALSSVSAQLLEACSTRHRAASFASSARSMRYSEKGKGSSEQSRRFPTGMDEVTPPAGVLPGTEERNQRYFGASSIFPYGERQSPPPRHSIADHVIRRSRLSPNSLEDFTEPEPIVSHLLDLFWKYQASHLLLIDREIFLRHRKLAQEEDGLGDRNFYTPCLLYSILALASMISTDKGVKRYSAGPGGIPGDVFNQRARVLFEVEMETPAVTTVQAAILIGARYGTFVDSCLGWTFSGMAFRMATKLALHLDCSKIVGMGHMSEETAQNRLVTFWGCYVEDKLYSAYCQRPTMLMDWDITIAAPQEQAQAKPYMSPNLLPWTVSLNRLCGKILLGLYAQRHYNNCDDGLKKIASGIHRELWEWQHDLPEDLSWPPTETTGRPSPSVLVLHMQFYYNLILLHRPFLEFSRVRREITQGPNSPTTSTTTCAIAAANIVRLVRDYRQHYNIRQISPNAVHITFIAATIHLINFRLTNAESHDQLLRGCIPALSELGDSYPIAQKALSILSTLIKRFVPQNEDSGEEEAVESRRNSLAETGIRDAEQENSKTRTASNERLTSGNPDQNAPLTHAGSPTGTWLCERDTWSQDGNEPLEVPPLIDLGHPPKEDHMNDQSWTEEIDSGAYSDVGPLPPDLQRYYDEPMNWFPESGAPLMQMGLDESGLDADTRNLFDVFYGRTNGLN